MKNNRNHAVILSRTLTILFLVFSQYNNINAQYIEINYYDQVMRVVSLPDYLINIQTENVHNIIIHDSALVSFIRERMDSLVEDDSIPQLYDSDVQLVYVFQNGKRAVRSCYL